MYYIYLDPERNGYHVRIEKTDEFGKEPDLILTEEEFNEYQVQH